MTTPGQPSGEAVHRVRVIESKSPHRWPNGARIAVIVVPNIEVFDDSRPLTARGPVPDTRALAEREYGNRIGVHRIRTLLADFEMAVTAAVSAGLAVAYPKLLASLAGDGWEAMGHGYVNNTTLLDYEPGRESAVIESCLAALETATGRRPRGWLSPGLHETADTLTHLLDAGVDYVCDWVVDDQPVLLDAGQGRSIVSVPYTLEVNDKAAYDRRLLTPDEFAELAKRQFDYLYRESDRVPVVFALAIHPFLSGVPHRMRALEEILGHIRGHDGVWSATGGQVADAFRDAWVTEAAM